MFLSGFVCSKKTYEEKVDFLTKTMELPRCKMSIFWSFLELFFCGLKTILFYPEYQKMFLSCFFCSKKKHMRKSSIFDKNHGLNPLQSVDVFDFFRTSLFRSKKHSLLSRISKNVSFWLFFAEKKHIRKRSIFLNKPWTNPFGKCRFLIFLKNVTFVVYKAFFSIQNIKKFLFLAFFAQV